MCDLLFSFLSKIFWPWTDHGLTFLKKRFFYFCFFMILWSESSAEPVFKKAFLMFFFNHSQGRQYGLQSRGTMEDWKILSAPMIGQQERFLTPRRPNILTLVKTFQQFLLWNSCFFLLLFFSFFFFFFFVLIRKKVWGEGGMAFRSTHQSRWPWFIGKTNRWF